ncbi:hypothetical protein RJ639_003167 [Escallonia herrerae]|uniref:Prephenate/arogenate dehydrogenase domain-containing protein n=1 Tax=Escallonia herrerae TaxID=1293975 RepID=A0AA88W4B1_9ASTE|nr:hypothetical protein RJ639_003167 [Escallonia herrerae]
MATSSPSQRSLTIGIIGFGPFAQFLAKTMVKQGHSLRATSRSDYSELCVHLGISFFRDMEALLASDNDVVLLCTSILSLSEVVKSIPFRCLKRPTLFADVLSVKQHPREVLLQVLPEDSDVLCTHPMFGPESGRDGWQGLTFMYDRVRIRDEGCKMLEMTCEEHDKLAARSQFLTHTIGRILSELEIEPTCIDTLGFKKLVQLLTMDFFQKESTMRDSFDLFSGLYIHNRFAKQQETELMTMKQLQDLEHALEKVKQNLQERTDQSAGPEYS